MAERKRVFNMEGATCLPIQAVSQKGAKRPQAGQQQPIQPQTQTTSQAPKK